MSGRGTPQRGRKERSVAGQTTLPGGFLRSGTHRASNSKPAVEIIDDDGDEVKEVDPVSSACIVCRISK